MHHAQEVNLKSLTAGRPFAIKDGEDNIVWVCRVLERRGEVISFNVVNGNWDGTLCSRTGRVLTLGRSQPNDDPHIRVGYTGEFPNGLDNYNMAIAFVENKLKGDTVEPEVFAPSA